MPQFRIPRIRMATFSPYISAFILFFINLINYMDRLTIASVLDDIQKFYGLNDESSGLLQTAFVLSYMVMAPIFGYLGDRYSRKYIISFGIIFWSTTTFIGSLIPSHSSFWFFMMRALVGTGEASYVTIAPTIIADLFPRNMRTQVLGFFYFAIPVGSGLGYVVGSGVAEMMQEWQWALRVTPILGLVATLLVIFVLEEPPRGQSDGAVKCEHTSLKQDLKYLIGVRSYLLVTVGFTCICFATGALAWWAPTYMLRAENISGRNTTVQQ